MGLNIKNVTICKLPYQDHPFVHGSLDGRDVWLTRDGNWTEDETSPAANIPMSVTMDELWREKLKKPRAEIVEGSADLADTIGVFLTLFAIFLGVLLWVSIGGMVHWGLWEHWCWANPPKGDPGHSFHHGVGEPSFYWTLTGGWWVISILAIGATGSFLRDKANKLRGSGTA